MASSLIATTTQSSPFSSSSQGALVGSRWYTAPVNNGTDLVFYYSDNDGSSWTAVTLKTGSAVYRGSVMYDSTNSRVNFAYAAGNSITTALFYRAVTSNLTSGSPGLSTEVTVQSGGANAGTQWPHIHMSGGATPRYWIIAGKTTASNTSQTWAWRVAAGSSADTAGNWASSNFTNLGSNSDANAMKSGIGWYWTIGGNPRTTFLWFDGSAPHFCEAVTFDPTAGTPTPGTVTSSLLTWATTGGHSYDAEGVYIQAVAFADYAIVAVLDNSTGTDLIKVYKTTNGTSYTLLTNGSFAGGAFSLTKSGSNAYIVYSSPDGAAATTDDDLFYRKITVASDTVDAAGTAFSDNQGRMVSCPADTGTSLLRAIYRSDTASPFDVRSDVASIAAVVGSKNMTLMGCQ